MMDSKKSMNEVDLIIKGLKPNETVEVERMDEDRADLIKDEVIKKYGYKGHTILVESDGESDERYRLIVNTNKKNLSIVEDFFPKERKVVLSFSTKEIKDLMVGVENKIHLKSQFFVMQKLSHLVKKNESNLGNDSEFSEKEPFGEYTKEVDKIKYISLDVDDTVFKTSDIYEVFDKDDLKKFAENTRELLNIGIDLYVNTGRGVMDTITVIETLEKLGSKIDFAVCENGSVFLNYSKIRNETNLTDEKIEKACAWVDGIGKNEKEFRDHLYKFLQENVVDKGLALFEKGKMLGISLNPIKEGTIEFRRWLKLFLRENKQKIISGLDNDSEDLLEAMINKMTNSTTAVDLNPCRKLNGEYMGINKSDGIDLFCQQMGDIEMDKDNKTWQIVGMGDSGGDVPVFIRTKWNMVPLNGYSLTTEEVKKEMEKKYGCGYDIGFVSAYETTKGCNQFFELLIEARKK